MGGSGPSRPGPAASYSTPSLTAPSATDSLTCQPNVPPDSRQTVPRASLAAPSQATSARAGDCRRHRRPEWPLRTAPDPPTARMTAGNHPRLPLPSVPSPSRHPSVDSGLVLVIPSYLSPPFITHQRRASVQLRRWAGSLPEGAGLSDDRQMLLRDSVRKCSLSWAGFLL